MHFYSISPHQNYSAVAEQLARHKIQGLVVIGGFEAFHAVLQLHEQREKFKQFRIPMVSTTIMSLRKEVNKTRTNMYYRCD